MIKHCCIYCDTDWDARGDSFMLPFEAARRAIRQAEKALLVIANTADPEDRKRYNRAHKYLVRVRRDFNRTEQIRCQTGEQPPCTPTPNDKA